MAATALELDGQVELLGAHVGADEGVAGVRVGGAGGALTPEEGAALVGMVALAGRWWLEVRKPRKEKPVVEDDTDIAGVLRRSLDKEGYDVRIAGDGETALDEAAARAGHVARGLDARHRGERRQVLRDHDLMAGAAKRLHPRVAVAP